MQIQLMSDVLLDRKSPEKKTLYIEKSLIHIRLVCFFCIFQILNQKMGRELRNSETNYFLNLLQDAFTYPIATLKQSKFRLEQIIGM